MDSNFKHRHVYNHKKTIQVKLDFDNNPSDNFGVMTLLQFLLVSVY